MTKCILALAVIGLLVSAAPVLGDEEIYLEYPAPPGRAVDPSWPPDGAGWHMLAPTYCAGYTQTGHEDDNGDGEINACEHITLSGQRWHIKWVGPTYKMVRTAARAESMFVEPIVPGGERQHTYHMVHPVFCTIIETAEPIEYECQEVYITSPPEKVGWWHCKRIKLNIKCGPPMTPVDQSTWGKIKAWLGNLF